MSENQNETPTMEEAVRQTRYLIGRMASAIKSVTGSSSSINGQDIPNEIRGILNQSPVTKTYYDDRTYLNDIGTLLKQGGSTTINAQDFPDVILHMDPAQIMYDQLMQWDKINSTLLTIQDFKTFYNRANDAYGADNWSFYATYATRYGYSSDYISIGAVPSTVTMVYGENGYNQGERNGHGNDWYPSGAPNVNYECVTMYKDRWSSVTWSSWINKDDTYIGSDNYFQGYGYGWDKYSILR